MTPPAPLIRGDTPSLGSREAWERGARRGSARLARRRPGERGSGFCRGTAGRGSRRARRGRTSGERCAAGERGAGPRARPELGCHRAAAEGRGHTHPAARLPFPPAPRTPKGRRRAGAPWAAESLAGAWGLRGCWWPGLPCRVWPPRPVFDFLLRPAPPRTFCGGRGEGSGLRARRGSGGRGVGSLQTAPAFACDAPSSAAPCRTPRPAMWAWSRLLRSPLFLP